jgi:hypothetical protein
MARFSALGCVYAFGVVAIIASAGKTQQSQSCPSGINERKPLIGVRLVGVTPPIALPDQQVVTVVRQYTEESKWLYSSCSTSKTSRYLPTGTITVVDNEIQFAFGFSALDLTSNEETASSRPLGLDLLIRNGSPRGITIDWNAVTLINDSGRAYGVIHRGVKMADSSAIVAPSTIPPGAILEDFVYPKELISFSGGRYGSGWVGINYFEKMKSPQRFKLYLPVKHGNDTVEYQFIFAIGAPES